uniref:Uncharacterized protein n=1 Tax=viral metagenome TaxID=1070528 RepID=A0A6H1ZC33_9ZZZZ
MAVRTPLLKPVPISGYREYPELNPRTEQQGLKLLMEVLAQNPFSQKLFERYIGSSLMPVEFMDQLGGSQRSDYARYHPEEGIQMSQEMPSREVLPSLVHELQHGVRDWEGELNRYNLKDLIRDIISGSSERRGLEEALADRAQRSGIVRRSY